MVGSMLHFFGTRLYGLHLNLWGLLHVLLMGCLFSLITHDPKNPKGKPVVRGVLGIHVDDGIGAGDDYFKQTIERLRKIYDSWGIL